MFLTRIPMGSFLSTWDAGTGLSKILLGADTLPLPFLAHLQQLNQLNQRAAAGEELR